MDQSHRTTSLFSGRGGIRRLSSVPSGRRAVAVIGVLLFLAVASWAQAPAPDRSQTKPGDRACQQSDGTAARASQAESQPSEDSGDKKPSGPSDDSCTPQSKDESEGKQTNRIMGVVPNFAAVSANTQLPPLSTKGKFWLATEDSFDYSSFVWTGILAGQEFGLNNFPEFGQGMAGYGRYYWHTFVDGVSGTYFTEAIVPWITREDPRYYTLGHGGFFRRTAYALTRVILTKTDSESTSFNWSEVGGNALEAGLSNAYYPPEERGLRQTAINWGAQLESAALNNIAKEFWPDFRRVVLRQK
jgi:hypothetical protein